MATIAEMFALAWKHHQAGGLTQAELLYRQVLKADPKHADACCFLAAACQSQGKLAEAELNYRRAIKLAPGYASAHNMLGMLLIQQGQLAQAVASFKEAVRAQRHNPEMHNNLGLGLARQGQWAAAVGCYRQALALKPDFAAAHYNLGLALNAQSQPEEAIAHFQEALRLQPQYPEALVDLGIALVGQNRLAEAASSIEEAIRQRPHFAEAHYNLGGVFDRQGKDEKAMACYRDALRIKPDYADAHINLANGLYSQGNLDDAMSHFLEARRLRPDHPQTNLSCALAWLMRGDFEHGWPAYEWRWNQPDSIRRSFTQPLWDGSPLGGRTILLHAELGLGDTIQFIRFAPLVKERGGKVIVECQSALMKLLASAAGIDQLVARGSAMPPFNVQAPLLSLPGILHTTVDDIPAHVPYLRPDPALVDHWRRELQSSVFSPSDNGPAFKIGIAWQGNPKYGHDRQRSIALKHFFRLAEVKGIQLISLQKGHGLEQLQCSHHAPRDDGLPGTPNKLATIIDLGSRLDETSGAFMDTAALMVNLDLVVSSDTAIAHFAGALGVRVWVAIPFVSDWRWLLERQDSPWYPTMRLFRQRRLGDWADVFDRMALELSNSMTALG